MTHDQFLQCVRVFSRRRPFREFCIEFLSGQQIVVKHPDAIGSYGNV
jgi:hypothetical protein